MSAPTMDLTKTRVRRPAPARSPRRAADQEPTPLSDREIVEAATAIIAEVGVDGLTMRRLSDHLGVALGATYHHVANKHDLLVLVVQELFGRVEPPDATAPWDQQVKQLMLSVASIVTSHPGMAGFMIENVDSTHPERLYDLMHGILLDAGFEERDIAAVLSALFFYVGGMAAGGPSAQNASRFHGHDVQQLFEEGLDMLLVGATARIVVSPKAARSRRKA